MTSNTTAVESQAALIVDSIFKVLVDGSEAEYFGEAISQLEHSLQCAEQAVEENADDETILGALLHDIGQFADAESAVSMLSKFESTEQDNVNVGVQSHEVIGGNYLRRLGFSEKVCQLVQSHVVAKRYLTGKYTDYHDQLSEASKMSLIHQGGPFTKQEIEEFEQNPYHKEIVKMRLWDDKAKLVDHKALPLEFYREKAVNHLINQLQVKV